MKNKFTFFVVFFALTVRLATAQDYSYKNYTAKDGLAGNHVYHMVQDKQGYLWFATQTGVSRFDGRNFVNYTVEQGLPSNEVLRLFVDSKGRVWMMPFTGQVCYYQNGKIYNSTNDSLLRKLTFKTFVADILEDDRHNLIFSESKGNLSVLTFHNTVMSFKSNMADYYSMGLGKNREPQLFLSNYKAGFSKLKTELFDIKIGKDTVWLEKVDFNDIFFGDKSSESYISPKLLVVTDRIDELAISTQLRLKFNNGAEKRIPREQGFNNFFLLNDSMIFVNTQAGSFKYDYLKERKIDEFLTDENVTNCFVDNENSLWFSTANHGVFRLYTTGIKNYIWKNKNNYFQDITSVGGNGRIVFVGNGSGEFFRLQHEGKFLRAVKETNVDYMKGMNQRIKNLHGNLYVLDQMIFSIYENGKLTKIQNNDSRHFSIKDFDIDDKGRLFIAFHSGACYVDPLHFGRTRKLGNYNFFSNTRTTSVAIAGDTVYFGSLKGMMAFDLNGKNIVGFSDIPLPKVSISSLMYHEGLLWIGTHQNGVMCFDGKKLLKNFSVKDGLPENAVRCLFAKEKKVWVGTNKGLAEISFDASGDFSVVETYSKSDGLVSDVVNDLYASNDTIFVAADEGLSVITDHRKKNKGVCLLNVPTVRLNSVIADPSHEIKLNPGDDILFEFSGISFVSEGEIKYQYRLLGLDTLWKKTSQRVIDFSYLPYGWYRLELIAVNKFGVKSPPVEVAFSVKKQFYEEWYFRIVILIAISLLVWLLFQQRVRYNKEKYNQRLRNAERIMQLEQEALKAQMNPHFIFNCLNAIQHFIIEKDVRSANKFITSFAGLIRQALDNSGKKQISLAEEIVFLQTYIDIEKSRFEKQFESEIIVGEGIDTSLLQIPPMLIQPFVENAINHGLLHKKDGAGRLSITFFISNDMLNITVTDNGIGREKSGRLTLKKESHYVSRGIDLTERRINRLNVAESGKIKLSIEDKFDDQGNPEGTSVELLIPLMFNS